MEKNFILIKLENSYYYPGEIIKGNIYINIEEEIKPGIEFKIKGKKILKANPDYITSYTSEENEKEEIKNIELNNTNNNNDKDSEDENSNNSKSIKSKKKEEEEIEKSEKKEEEIEKSEKKEEEEIEKSEKDKEEIEKSNYKYYDNIEIFNIKTNISNEKINIGQYIFPFMFKLNKKIPGTCILLERNIFAEVYYSIRIKMENLNGKIIKNKIPLIIRQNENDFNYKQENKITKNDNASCCCKKSKVIVNCKLPKKYYLYGEKIDLNYYLDNKKGNKEGESTIIILYKKIILHPKQKDMIEIPIQVLKKENYSKIKSKENFSINFNLDYQGKTINKEALNMSKNYKIINNINLIKYLCCSCINDLFSVEYEFYIKTNLVKWTLDEIGVFISTIFYPPNNISDYLKEKILINFNGKNMDIIKINFNDLENFTQDDEISFGNNLNENNNSSYLNNSSRKFNEQLSQNTKKEIKNSFNNYSFSEQSKNSKSLKNNNNNIKKNYNKDWIDKEIDLRTIENEI